MRFVATAAATAALWTGCGYLPNSDMDTDNGADQDTDKTGQGVEGALCTSTAYCASGLACASSATCQAAGSPGTAGAGGTCTASSDCQLFLTCENGSCAGSQPTIWTGASCQPAAPDTEPLKVYFEVNGTSGEFYRLPFPNDIRRRSGKIDLSGHANPGVLVEELGNPVDDFFDVVQNDLDGFGTQSAVFFRFNHYPRNETLVLNQDPAKQSIFMFNLNPTSEEYGPHGSFGFRANSARGNYICGNWLAIYPGDGRPLDPGTTYAAVLTTAITDKDGNPVQADDDFLAMLAPTAPADAALTAAWQAYQPLRDFLNDTAKLSEINALLNTDISAATIAAAAVFTTGNPTRHVPKIREAVRNEPVPSILGLMTDNSHPLYSLYTGTVSTPFYQSGERPFAAVADGGAISYDAKGLPVRVEIENVKFALSVPAGTAPDTGWPLIIYAHGTGGSEMSFAKEGIAERMAAIDTAVLGMEQVQHGNRRAPLGQTAGASTPSPENLFYNFINPRTSRDNNMQAAAELFQAARLIESFDVQAGTAIGFDFDRIYFFGHSQGTQGSFLGAVFEPRIKGIVLSGAGGFLIESLLGKTKPVDVASAIRLALMEISVDRVHPLLNIIQAAFDEVDPVNYADYVFREDLTAMGIGARSLFMASGLGDTYAPEKTQFALARALHLKQWAEDPASLFEADELLYADGTMPPAEEWRIQPIDTLPHERTYSYGGGVTTVVVRYEPSGYDGHFVMFEHPGAIAQSDEFIRTMIDPESPYPVLIGP